MNDTLGIILWLLFLAALFALYWLPTVIAVKRQVRNVGSIVAINLLAGWLFVGWVVALAMALSDPKPPAVYPPPGYPQLPPGPPNWR